jgi:beta-lactamase class A
VIVAVALPPPVIEQPAPHQISYGLVTGRAARGTTRIVVFANGRRIASRPLAGRRFSLKVSLPVGEVSVRVATLARGGRRSSAHVHEVLGLPPGSRPRVVGERPDAVLTRSLARCTRRFGGVSGYYVQSLTGGTGAAWNAGATFPGASTMKLAIATAVLARHAGLPRPGSEVYSLLWSMLTQSDNASANALEVWLGGSTSGGSHIVNGLMQSIGMRRSEMYGGYELRTLESRIPVRVEHQPAYGYGKHTTARDISVLLRSIWLASGGRGPLRSEEPGFTPADGRYLMWLLAHARDVPKLDRVRVGNPGVVVAHKAGWVVSTRNDSGLVFWRGGVFVASVMTWSSRGVGVSADVLAGCVARVSLERFRRTEG